jgi:dihydroorotate dehydrogenase
MYASLKPLIFRVQPETAHELTMKMLQIACRIPGFWVLKRWFSVIQSSCSGSGWSKFPNPSGVGSGL